MLTVYQVHSFSDGKPHLAYDEMKDLRKSKGKQWLGDGYYFWEHILCARLWMHQRGHNANIYRAEIPFKEKQDKFLDLHSNTNDMIEFYLLAQRIKEELQKRKSDINPTLNQIIYMLHRKNHFKNNQYIGLRCASPWNIGVTNFAEDTEEKFYFFQKIQYCIFKFAANEIIKFDKYNLNAEEENLFFKLGI